jgi:Phosphoinositide phospholipase C, Ca2+-dependent
VENKKKHNSFGDIFATKMVTKTNNDIAIFYNRLPKFVFLTFNIHTTMKSSFVFLMLFSLTFSATAQHNAKDQIRLNNVQVIGSHNSYKIAIEPAILDYLFQKDSSAKSLQYEHISLTEQLKLGLRNLEIDVYHDPEGGYYSNPRGLDIVKNAGQTPLPFDEESKLKLPGLKVFHVQDIDFRSSQLLFKDALNELVEWSKKNPKHTPIIITLNTKDAKIPLLRNPLPFDSDALQSLDGEIKSGIGIDKLITPDLVRGDHDNLEQAILKVGWPMLNDVKGRFLFVLDEGDSRSDLYLEKFPRLKNATMFINKKKGHPEAAFLIVNDPIKNFELIKELVASGYMVRTRADSDTREARTEDYTKFEKAKASGAQVITTDYYIPSKLFQSKYKINFEDGTFERILNH